MVDRGWCRNLINQQTSRVKRLFKWAVGRELVAPGAYHALQAVDGLKVGRSGARESDPVTPVADAVVDATLAVLPPTLRGMVELQRLTGMRPMEVCRIRTCDIDQAGEVWIYRPPYHKMTHKGRPRQIYIGPRAQRVLGPFLLPDLQAFIFSPKRAMEERLAQRHEERVTPMNEGNRPGSNRVRKPQRLPGESYCTCS